MDQEDNKDKNQQGNVDEHHNADQNQEEQEVTNLADDPVLGDMISRLTGTTPKAPEVKPATEDDGGDSDEEEGRESDSTQDQEDDDKLKVVKPAKSLQQQVQEELARIDEENKSSAQHQKPATPKPEAQPKESGDIDSIDIDGLSDDEQDYLDLLKYGAKKAGHQYADHLKKFVAFAKKRNELKERLQNEDPDSDIDDNDQLKNFTRKNMAVIPKKEIRAIQRMQVREEVESELAKKYDDKIKDIDTRVKQSEIAPKVEAESSRFSQSLSKIAMNKEAFGGDDTIPSILKAMTEKGVEAVQEENPLFSQIVTSSFQEASKAAKELVKLTRFGENGINVFKEDDPTHNWLVDFITQQDQVFAEKGGAKRVRDGKQFVTQQVWTQLPQAERSKKWTFSLDDRLRHIQANAVMQMRRNVENLRQGLEKAGFTKKQIDQQIASQAAKKDNTPASPKVKQTIPPGTSTTEKPSEPQKVLSPDEFAALGLPAISS